MEKEGGELEEIDKGKGRERVRKKIVKGVGREEM